MREGYKLREILFKAKRVDNNKWEYGLIARIGIETSNIINKEFEILVPVKTKTISQFTGLTDENEVKIFENDIVEYEDAYNDDVFVNTGEVYWCEDTMCFYFTERQSISMSDFYVSNDKMEDVRVIGNVFDNPELIGGK